MNKKNENLKTEKVDNPMQERPSVVGNERGVLAAEEILEARRLEAKKEAERTSTTLFVP